MNATLEQAEQQGTRPGSLVYRCSLCGATFTPYQVPDIDAVQAALKAEPPTFGAWREAPPGMTMIHQCTPKLSGHATFVGVQAH